MGGARDVIPGEIDSSAGTRLANGRDKIHDCRPSRGNIEQSEIDGLDAAKWQNEIVLAGASANEMMAIATLMLCTPQYKYAKWTRLVFRIYTRSH